MWSAAKTSSVFIIFGLSIFSGLLSCIAIHCLANRLGISGAFRRALSVLNCFSGGVFFAASVLNLLPEAREDMGKVLIHYDVHTEYPLTEALMGVGFFVILGLEHMAYAVLSKSKTDVRNIKSKSRKASARNQTRKTESKRGSSVTYKKLSQEDNAETATDSEILVRDFEDSSYLDDVTYQTYGTVDDTSLSSGPYPAEHKPKPKEQVYLQESEQIVIRDNNIFIHKNDNKASVGDALKSATEVSGGDSAVSKLRRIILLLALSLHMVFDGLALGLLQKESKIWTLVLSLSLHKVLIFFTIGIELLEILNSLKTTIAAVIVFALVSPCGILIGESINGDDVTGEMASAILQGIATGTFLYVTFFEILQKEFGSSEHDLLKVFATVFGFALIAAVRLSESEEGD